MGKTYYIMMVDEQIVALSKDRNMIEAYNEFKDNVGLIQMIPKIVYKELIKTMEELVLEETDYRVPLTNREVVYVDRQIGDVNHIAEQTVKDIRRLMDFVDEDDQHLLVSVVKKLNHYITPKKAFRKLDMKEVLSEVYCDGSDNNIIEKTNTMNNWRNYHE